METALFVLAGLLVVSITALGAGLVMSVRAIASVKDREILHRTLNRFADRLVTEKDQQMERAQLEAQVEMGATYMEAQQNIERLRSRRGGPRLNGQPQPTPPDVRVEMDES